MHLTELGLVSASTIHAQYATSLQHWGLNKQGVGEKWSECLAYRIFKKEKKNKSRLGAATRFHCLCQSPLGAIEQTAACVTNLLLYSIGIWSL